MEIQVQELSTVTRRLIVRTPADDVDNALRKAYKKLQKEVIIKGFRPGKAPLSMLERHYAPQALANAAEALVERYYEQAMKEAELAPLGPPSLDFDLPEQGKEFEFRLDVDVLPPIELDKQAYKGFKLKEPRLEVTDEQVTERLEFLRGRQSSLEKVENRPVQKGDVVILNYKSFLADKLVESESGEHLEVEAGTARPEIDAVLIGANKGDTVETMVHYESDAPNEELRDKDVKFVMDLTDIMIRQMPDLDDEFAKSLSTRWSSLQELKDSLKKDMETSVEQQKDHAVRKQIVDHLNELATFELPPALVKSELNEMIEGFKEQMRRSGMDPEQVGMDMENLNKEFTPTAERKVRAGLVLSKITDLEEIKVEQEDLDAEMERLAASVGQPAEALKDLYKNNNFLSSLTTRLMEQKTLQLIKANAIIEVVDPADLDEAKPTEKTD